MSIAAGIFFQLIRRAPSMSSGLDSLIADVDGVLVRLTLAHEDLLTCVRTADKTALAAWYDVKLAGLREGMETLGRRRRSDAAHALNTFRLYDAAAVALIDVLLDDDEPKKTVQEAARADASVDVRKAALMAAYATTREACERVVQRARVRRRFLTAGLWVGGVATSVALATVNAQIQSYFKRQDEQKQAEQRAKEAVTERDLDHSSVCDAKEWAEVESPIDRSKVMCRSFVLHTWSAARAYQLQATLPLEPGKPGELTQIATMWLSLPELGGRDGPNEGGGKPSISTWICNVSNDTELRVLVWWQEPTRLAVPRVRAYVRREGESPCS